MMNKTFSVLTLALALSSAAFADDGNKQVVTVNGSATGKVVQKITFNGDNVNLTYTDGTTETADMEAVVITFEQEATGISVSSVQENGDIKKIYDINGRQMRATMESLPTGVYIVKSANKTVKYIKK